MRSQFEANLAGSVEVEKQEPEEDADEDSRHYALTNPIEEPRQRSVPLRRVRRHHRKECQRILLVRRQPLLRVARVVKTAYLLLVRVFPVMVLLVVLYPRDLLLLVERVGKKSDYVYLADTVESVARFSGTLKLL